MNGFDQIDWEAIGVSAILNFILSIILIFIFSPLSILGPIIGGFIYNRMSIYPNETISGGALSGAISGLLTGIIVTLGVTSFTLVLGIFASAGVASGAIGALAGILITIVMIIVNALLSVLGAVIEKVTSN